VVGILGGELGCWLSLVEVLSWHEEYGFFPLEKITCLVPHKDWYVLRTGTMGPSCTPLAPDGQETITRLTRAVPLLLGWKVIV
jgi:hypothetical protein